jgi:hypothetical protein
MIDHDSEHIFDEDERDCLVLAVTSAQGSLNGRLAVRHH